MGSIRAVVVLFGAVGAIASARAGEPAHRHKISPDLVLGTKRSMALALFVPDGMLVDRVDRAELLGRVGQALRDAGVSVLSWQEAQPIVDAEWEAVGPLDRADTDAEVMRRWESVYGAALRKLRARSGVGRLVVVALLPQKKTAVDGEVRWDGVAEHAIAPGAWSWELQKGRHELWALSVAVWVHGDGGKLLYGEGGGLRLMELAGPEAKAVPIPDADLLADPERNARAVELALAPLFQEMKAAGMLTRRTP